MKELYSKTEEYFNGGVHLLGSIFAIVAISSMLVITGVTENKTDTVCSLLYGFFMLLGFLVSSVYHLSRNGKVKNALKIATKCCFFVMSAGVSIPLAFSALSGKSSLFLFITVATLCVLGIVLNAVDSIKFKKFSFVLYLLSQSFFLVFSSELYNVMTGNGYWLYILGYIIIIIGAFFSIFKKPFFHTCWHVLLLTGTIIQFLTIELNIISIQLF